MPKAMFGAGCFWGVEAAFRRLEGVKDALSGYSGGTVDKPSYQQVCTSRTGHAEVVEVDYDDAKVSYEQLLDTFWGSHDPTTLNRQGPDVGTQYRSAIYTYSPEQEAAAHASLEKLDADGRFGRKIVTEIKPAETFWPAEEYHQKYLEKRGVDVCH